MTPEDQEAILTQLLLFGHLPTIQETTLMWLSYAPGDENPKGAWRIYRKVLLERWGFSQERCARIRPAFFHNYSYTLLNHR